MTRPAMRLERVEFRDGGAQVTTTGAVFAFRSAATSYAAFAATPGATISLTIDAHQRLPSPRRAVRFDVGGISAPARVSDDAESATWRAVSQSEAQAVLRFGPLTATIRSDSVVILEAPLGATISAHAAFHPAYHESAHGRSIVLDETGGFGVYPVQPAATRDADAAHATMPIRGPIWLAVFPPRPADPEIEASPLAHEGRPQRFGRGLDDAYPSRAVLEDAARTCRILAVHAYVWRAAPLAVRLRPGRHFLRRCEWRTPRHEPADPVRFRRLLDDARSLGLRVPLYVSPRHSCAADIFGEMERIVAEHAPDGLYLDEVADDLPTLDATVRRAREILGPDRILYLNAAAEPFGTPRVWAPFVDAHCDLVLRGSEGRSGLPLATFLRYAVSGRNTSGAAGYWCHYGGRVFEQPPTDDEIAAVRAAGAHLWRRSRWGARALVRFDGVVCRSR